MSNLHKEILPLLDLVEPITCLPVNNTMPLSTFDQIAYATLQSISNSPCNGNFHQSTFFVRSCFRSCNCVLGDMTVSDFSSCRISANTSNELDLIYYCSICYQHAISILFHDVYSQSERAADTENDCDIGNTRQCIIPSCHVCESTYSDMFERLSSRTEEC